MRFTASTLLMASTAMAASNLGGLNQMAKAAGKMYFGTATDNSELTDTAFVEMLKDPEMWGALTPGNTQKWQYTEKTQGVFTFADGDVIADLAASQNMLLRCHTLVWYSQLPQWVTSGTWTKDTLTKVMETHITNEVKHYQGKCYSWDVVNEALEENGTFRDNVFHKNIGEEYIPLAFQYAAAADSTAKLYYNDYNIETSGAKAKAAVSIVESVKAAGAPIHGVGLQAHLIVGQVSPKASYVETLQSFLDAGVEEVAYTELDIRHSSLPPSDSALAKQGDDYAAVVGACMDVAKCIGVTIWGFTDKHSWVPNTFKGAGDALLFDKELQPKPAYHSVSALLAAAGPSTAITVTATASATMTAAQIQAATPNPNSEEETCEADDDNETTPSSSSGAQGPAATNPSTPDEDDSCDPEDEDPTTSNTPSTPGSQPSSNPSTPTTPVSTQNEDDTCDPEEDEPAYSSTPNSAPSSAPSSARPSSAASGTTPPSSAQTGSNTGSGAAGQFQQCGGTGYSGPTACAAGFTCTVQNEYYSQCL
ncbi:Endo-1 4-beta-xylanase [Ceratocystis platani]|uniref:Beta-xylanase n=1 Tax=Ceratocystis fimbriata f. sp. platani TaxID=88771 RepID=A0A0F8CUH4_CERFI|nr:Endo-1 4-beta-xylanase [Ceratocystis platani]